MRAADFAYLVEMLEERILVAGALDPCRQQRAAARHDALDTLMTAQALHRLARHAAVERHEVHALLGLALDDIEEVLGAEFHDRAFGADLVNRHGADHHRASRDQLDANLVEVGAGRKIHHRIGAEADRGVELLDFLFEELMEVGRADIRIDLGAQSLADADRAELMMDVARDDDLAGRDALADQLGREALVFRDLDHLLSDNAFSGGFDLGHEVLSQR